MVDYTHYPELIRAIKNTEYVENLNGSNGGFHPMKTPKAYVEPLNDIHAVKLFSELVGNITDSDYGDFMRRANSYLCDLKSHLKNATGSIRKKIEEMQYYTQFAPNWDVETTRTRLLKDAEILQRWSENLSRVQKPLAKPERKSSVKQTEVATAA